MKKKSLFLLPILAISFTALGEDKRVETNEQCSNISAEAQKLIEAQARDYEDQLRQAKAYQQKVQEQLNQAEAQYKQVQKQLDRNEVQAQRLEALQRRWEQQADRYDRILSAW